MHSIAILGFFTLVVLFFFTGRKDFGLKPTSKENNSIPNTSNISNEVKDEIKLEKIKI